MTKGPAIDRRRVDFPPALRYFRTMTARLVAAITIALALSGCDGGLAPPVADKGGFGGTIRFVRSSWPPADSIFGLWLFTAQSVPSDSTAIFAGLFSDPPTIYLYPGLTASLSEVPVDSLSYAIYPAPATYVYTGVIQQTTSSITTGGLRVVGLYTKPLPGFVPETLRVEGSMFITGVDIDVDFANPPPQPF